MIASLPAALPTTAVLPPCACAADDALLFSPLPGSPRSSGHASSRHLWFGWSSRVRKLGEEGEASRVEQRAWLAA